MFFDLKLYDFDDCFGGVICMGDIDVVVECNGYIFWMEWKCGVVIDSFEKIYVV